MKLLFQKLIGLAGTLLAVTTVSAQNFAIDSFSIDSGGGTSVGGIFEVSGTIGQPEADPMSGGIFSLTGEFLSLLPADPPPLVEPTAIFDNSGGSDNGGFGVNATTWLASKFCLGTQSYGLDSVSLLLNSQDFSGGAGPPCAVQLQIYASDPVTGKPSSSTGLIMNLSGKTNPITLLRGQEWVKWIPATPFKLSAGTCYWAVLSAENGKRIGQIASFTKPTGDAASFGATSSANAGATWGTPTEASNNKMRIEATPIPTVPVESATIFDNTPGEESGGFGASTHIFLAGKFCLGSQSYRLDSLSLLLSSGNFSGNIQPPSTVRLRIYSHDPVSGKPAASTGLIMNLSGLVNPITLEPFHRVKWIPATPFTLSADTCYWAVLSVDAGAVAGWIPSAKLPIGDAGTFGYTRSVDSGATWVAPDDTANYKMRIEATPGLPPPPIPERAADGSTAIPGGTGSFTGYPSGPSLSGDHLAFHGAGTEGQQGVYVTVLGSPQSGTPLRIADMATPIPDGTGSFLSFGTESGIIIVSGNNAVFAGTGSGGQRGIYAAVLSPPQVGTPFRIADTATPIPGGSGNFTEFPGEPGVSGDHVVFAGTGSGGQQGVYGAAMAGSQSRPPFGIADTAAPIPGGTGNFTEFPVGPSVSGNHVVFAGNGADGQRGVYAAVLSPPQAGPPFRVADTTTAIPGGSGNFLSFGAEAGIIIVSGNTAVFGGTGSGGQQGIYAAAMAPPQVGPPSRVADTTTAIPGGRGNFTGFGEASVSETDLAFLGMGTGGQTGIYDLTRGQLLKVIAVGDAIKGKRITGLKFSRSGLFGDPVAFQATFEDGSQGVYRIAVVAPPFELRITGMESDGNNLRLSFTSLAGSRYAIQSRDDLSSGTWVQVPDMTTSGTGATLQLTIPNAFIQPPQFYRVQEVP